MTENTLLALLERAHPGRPRDELLRLIDETPDQPRAKPTEKPAGRRVGSRPRTDASMERRRSWASSGRLPPKLAARFTLAEHAVLAVIAVEVAGKGACELTVGHIAALAGVCNQTVRNAMREAVGLGVIRVEERRLTAWRNAPNRVTIVSVEWLSWLRLARKGAQMVHTPRNGGQSVLTPSKGGGSKSFGPTNTSLRKQAEWHSTLNPAKGFRRTEGEAERWARTGKDSAAPAGPDPLEGALARWGAAMRG